MAPRDHPIAALVDHVSAVGSTRAGRHAYRSLSEREPLLGPWTTAGDVAAAVRARCPRDQDPVIAALLRRCAGDRLGQLTVVSVLTRALGSVVAGWTRAGLPPTEIAEMEAELVAGCWEAAAVLARRAAGGEPVPDRVGRYLVSRAQDSVRGPRRRHRRVAALHQPLGHGVDVRGRAVRSSCEELSAEIAGAVRSGRLRPADAAPVFLTRVAGFDVAEAARHLGCSTGVLRALRSRAERRLVAGAA